MSGARKHDETLTDIGLGWRGLAATFAGKFQPRLRASQGQHALIDQRIVHDNVGLLQTGERIESEEARIARPSASEPE